MNRLLFAMSTTNESQISGLQKNDFEFEDKIPGDISSISDCWGALEPTAKYMLSAYPEDELELVILCTEDTVSNVLTENEGGNKYTAVSFFIYRMMEYLGLEADPQALLDELSMDKIFSGDAYYYGRISAKFISINEKNSVKGIRSVVEYIRSSEKKPEQFWIDAHGGFRDAALMLNGVVSLLEVYGIVPDQILGARFDREKKTQKIVDQSKSFEIFDFVSAMNEFIKFGIADSLVEIFEKDDSAAVRRLVLAMNDISDGTRLCDPGLYIKGLDELGDVLENQSYDNDLLAIFEDYIREDYGVLLDKNKRTPLDIVKRCADKKLYQQALTFIESLMPDEFIRNKVLFFARGDKSTVTKIRDAAAKKYLSPEHFAFDQFLFQLNGFYACEQIEYGNYKKTAHDSDTSLKDFASANLLSKDIEDIRDDGIESDNFVIKITSPNSAAIGEIELFTNVKSEHYQKTVKLLRLHNAIKNCRNLTNHAKEGFRATPSQIAEGISKYVLLSEIILDGEGLINRNVTGNGKTKCLVANNKKKKTSASKTNSSGTQNNDGANSKDRKEMLTIKKAGKTFRGILENGEEGVIGKNFLEGVDPTQYVDKTIEVYVQHKNGDLYMCEPVNKL